MDRPVVFFYRRVFFLLLALLHELYVLIGGAGGGGPQGGKNLMDLLAVIPGQQALYNGVEAFISIFLVGSSLAPRGTVKNENISPIPQIHGGPGGSCRSLSWRRKASQGWKSWSHVQRRQGLLFFVVFVLISRRSRSRSRSLWWRWSPVSRTSQEVAFRLASTITSTSL